jgi:RHH-type transcriptional regulator, proline utilization regulon repressor / proline dehydrogenase / delta 1-pyrroline-5-carboxylate dehydrogenase
VSDLPPFANEPSLELRRAPERAALLDALGELDAAGVVRAPVWVGEERREGEQLVSRSPADPERVVALAAVAGQDDVDAALDAAVHGAEAWRASTAAERARVLLDVAKRLRARRRTLAALELRECGKPWADADADVCEAIDFLEYYAREAIALEGGRPLAQVPGEHNAMRYVPCGVVAVIAPWNFPLAIPTGMVAAALAAGNPVVLKPAEQAPGCAAELVDACRAAGVPSAALGLLPGPGEVGRALAIDPRVRLIAFTGSAAVGREILREAAELRDGQAHHKRVVAEMGGKNCIIVDSDADLDEAVPAIVASAFGYAGQKCSACARVLAHERIAEVLFERLAGAIAVLQVGAPEDFATEVPPLIEREAQERVNAYLEACARDGRIIARAECDLPRQGWYCAPTLAGELPADAAVLAEEVFGPLLTVEEVSSIAAACDVVDRLPFALTGGLFSRNPHVVEEVVRRSPVGNLYINREITGAMVARQPFGGTRLSGTGTKAGGPDYLMHFVEPRVVSENTVRHGLVL